MLPVAVVFIFRRYSETTQRASTYEVVARSEEEARKKIAERHGEQIAKEIEHVGWRRE